MEDIIKSSALMIKLPNSKSAGGIFDKNFKFIPFFINWANPTGVAMISTVKNNFVFSRICQSEITCTSIHSDRAVRRTRQRGEGARVHGEAGEKMYSQKQGCTAGTCGAESGGTHEG